MCSSCDCDSLSSDTLRIAFAIVWLHKYSCNWFVWLQHDPLALNITPRYFNYNIQSVNGMSLYAAPLTIITSFVFPQLINIIWLSHSCPFSIIIIYTSAPVFHPTHFSSVYHHIICNTQSIPIFTLDSSNWTPPIYCASSHANNNSHLKAHSFYIER